MARRRIYFVSDLHASERCWLKFLAAPKFYRADTVIVGGDITGKFVVPIIAQPGGAWTVQNFLGRKWRLTTRDELARLKGQIADTGQYAFETTAEEYAEYDGDQAKIDDLFRRLALDRVRRWVDMAEDKLSGAGVRCLVSGGNDDFYEVDEALAASRLIENPDGAVLDLGDGFQIMGIGYGNPTPWHCPRDIPEADLAAKIAEVADVVERPSRAIFSLHVPPYGSGLDFAPQLDDELRMVMSGAGPRMIPVGSTAVRDAIMRYQPMLALHGHIHESRGIRRLGHSAVANPGSEYGEGVLDGVLVDLDSRKGIVDIQLTSG
jgi:Icc-related predicted phosphoesterase